MSQSWNFRFYHLYINNKSPLFGRDRPLCTTLMYDARQGGSIPPPTPAPATAKLSQQLLLLLSKGMGGRGGVKGIPPCLMSPPHRYSGWSNGGTQAWPLRWGGVHFLYPLPKPPASSSSNSCQLGFAMTRAGGWEAGYNRAPSPCSPPQWGSWGGGCEVRGVCSTLPLTLQLQPGKAHPSTPCCSFLLPAYSPRAVCGGMRGRGTVQQPPWRLLEYSHLLPRAGASRLDLAEKPAGKHGSLYKVPWVTAWPLNIYRRPKFLR